MASAFDAFGRNVTVIEMPDRVRFEEDQDVKDELARLLECRRIDIRTGARVGISGVDQRPARWESGSGTMAGRRRPHGEPVAAHQHGPSLTWRSLERGGHGPPSVSCPQIQPKVRR
ncbi:MAG: NAD-binding protein [Verrucomicrobia bacterium]|nr:NAD-binding protein [Verrucomicrobiota bacterium]